MRYRTLGDSGIQVSELGFGAASLGEEYGSIDVASALRTVPAALDAGINFIDTSPYYGRGRSEVLLGYALRDVLKTKPRDEVVLCTKVGRYDADKFDYSASRVRESVDVSLHRLGVDHLDVVLCHDVEFVDLRRVMHDAIPTLRDLQSAGKIGVVGASGYPVAALREMVVRGGVDVVMSYANLTLHNRSLESLIPVCEEYGVGVLNAAPFDMQLLTDSEPQPWHPASAAMRSAVAEARRACAERGIPIAQLALQFAARAAGVTSTVVGTAFPEQIAEWQQWLDGEIDHELLDAVTAIFEAADEPPRQVGLPENN